MNDIKYMTVAECKLYRELAAQQGTLLPGMSMSFPCDTFLKDDFRKVPKRAVRKKRVSKKTNNIAVGSR